MECSGFQAVLKSSRVALLEFVAPPQRQESQNLALLERMLSQSMIECSGFHSWEKQPSILGDLLVGRSGVEQPATADIPAALVALARPDSAGPIAAVPPPVLSGALLVPAAAFDAAIFAIFAAFVEFSRSIVLPVSFGGAAGIPLQNTARVIQATGRLFAA
jgi:hypothetical protein